MVEQGKNTLDWFLNKNALKQLMILLLVIIGYLSWNYHNNIQTLYADVEYLKVVKTENDSLKIELERKKFENILTQANEDNSPLPQWLTDAKTGNILWLNRACEVKYLIPKGLERDDLIGNDGTFLFGQTMAELYKYNNNLVLIKDRPITFSNEQQNKITKYPVKIGSYTYAIAGIEYIKFEL